MNTEEIFPIVSIDPETKIWKCLGTGFFINPVGAFITAKHIFQNSDGLNEKTLYSVHYSKNEGNYIRFVGQLVMHPNADLIIGLLGERRIANKTLEFKSNKFYPLDLNFLNNGTKIYTQAYPNSERVQTNSKEFEFTFKEKISYGEIIDYHEEGSPIVKNRCFQTNMEIQSGASGGPVFKEGYIVGINSSGYNMSEGEEPLSFITPIDYILDLGVKEKGKFITVKELIDNEYIKIKPRLTLYLAKNGLKANFLSIIFRSQNCFSKNFNLI